MRAGCDPQDARQTEPSGTHAALVVATDGMSELPGLAGAPAPHRALVVKRHRVVRGAADAAREDLLAPIAKDKFRCQQVVA